MVAERVGVFGVAHGGPDGLVRVRRHVPPAFWRALSGDGGREPGHLLREAGVIIAEMLAELRAAVDAGRRPARPAASIPA